MLGTEPSAKVMKFQLNYAELLAEFQVKWKTFSDNEGCQLTLKLMVYMCKQLIIWIPVS